MRARSGCSRLRGTERSRRSESTGAAQTARRAAMAAARAKAGAHVCELASEKREHRVGAPRTQRAALGGTATTAHAHSPLCTHTTRTENCVSPRAQTGLSRKPNSVEIHDRLAPVLLVGCSSRDSYRIVWKVFLSLLDQEKSASMNRKRNLPLLAAASLLCEGRSVCSAVCCPFCVSAPCASADPPPRSLVALLCRSVLPLLLSPRHAARGGAHRVRHTHTHNRAQQRAAERAATWNGARRQCRR